MLKPRCFNSNVKGSYVPGQTSTDFMDANKLPPPIIEGAGAEPCMQSNCIWEPSKVCVSKGCTDFPNMCVQIDKSADYHICADVNGKRITTFANNAIDVLKCEKAAGRQVYPVYLPKATDRYMVNESRSVLYKHTYDTSNRNLIPDINELGKMKGSVKCPAPGGWQLDRVYTDSDNKERVYSCRSSQPAKEVANKLNVAFKNTCGAHIENATPDMTYWKITWGSVNKNTVSMTYGCTTQLSLAGCPKVQSTIAEPRISKIARDFAAKFSNCARADRNCTFSGCDAQVDNYCSKKENRSDFICACFWAKDKKMDDVGISQPGCLKQCTSTHAYWPAEKKCSVNLSICNAITNVIGGTSAKYSNNDVAQQCKSIGSDDKTSSSSPDDTGNSTSTKKKSTAIDWEKYGLIGGGIFAAIIILLIIFFVVRRYM